MTEIQAACAVLGVDSSTPLDEIKKKAKQLLLRYHPDMNPDAPVESGERTKSIIGAYKVISDYMQSMRGQATTAAAPQGAIPDTLLVFFAGGQEMAVSVTCVRGVLRSKDVQVTYQVNRNYPHYLGYFTYQDRIVSLFSSDILKNSARHSSGVGSTIIILNSAKGSAGILVDSVKGVESGISHQNEVVVENIFE